MDPVRLELSQYARAGPSAAVLHAARTISASASIPPPLAESIRTSSDIDLGLMNPFQDEPRQYAFKRRGAAAPALIAPKPPVPPVPRWAEQQTSKQQQLSRLPPPSNGASDGRNLVVFIDGPSYQFSKARNTHVVELYSRLIKDETQLAFYDSGTGTYAQPSWTSVSYYKHALANKLDLAFALRFEKIIVSAYAWLANNYENGDRIFLFGFARGAYQARALAAMIDIVGLIHKGNGDQIPFAYELYASSKSGSTYVGPQPRPTSKATSDDASEEHPRSRGAEKGRSHAESTQSRFKKAFARDVKVHFVGAWDTASSGGIPRNKTHFSTTDGMSHVRFFRHALAVDERRVTFLPAYARGGLGPEYSAVQSESDGPTADPSPPHTKEVWFAGSHGDIGGSAGNADSDTFGPALRWMSFEASKAGLRLSEHPPYSKEFQTSNSLTPFWRVVELLPLKRLTYNSATSTTHRPHLWAQRVLERHQFIHETIQGRFPGHQVERDPYTSFEAFLDVMKEHVMKGEFNPACSKLSQFSAWLSSERGQRSLRDLQGNIDVSVPLVEMLRISTRHAASKSPRLRNLARNTYQEDPEKTSLAVASDARREILHALSVLRDVSCPDDCLPLREMLGIPFSRSSWRSPLRFQSHESNIRFAAFTPDGDRVVSGSWDDTIRTWDSRTGDEVMEPIRIELVCLALSGDGARICAATSDGQLSFWNAGTGAEERSVRSGHTGLVHCVAFSPDGRYAVSGSGDATIRVWNAQTGEPVNRPLTGHTNSVLSVAFFSDGRRVVSGSADETVRVWDAKNGQMIGGSLLGHTHSVGCVAVSPSAAVCIASGSDDRTIRIWDGETGQRLRTLHGHSNWVRSIAFSPVSDHLVSGSYDGTIRLWDVEEGNQVGEPIEGLGHVACVAFSPDGTCVVAGSLDSTVRIWDRIPVEDSERRG